MLYTVEALEKFVVRTIYREVEADSPEEAERLVRAGEVSYDSHEIEEGDEQFIQVVTIEDANGNVVVGGIEDEEDEEEPDNEDQTRLLIRSILDDVSERVEEERRDEERGLYPEHEDPAN